MDKKLYRSKTDKKLAGVCGGIAEYLGMDATIVRLITVLCALFGSIGLIFYIIAALIIPEKPDDFVTVD